ncbi:TonB-dependent receptor domain-containing protein [Sphingomonas sp. MMS24-J13]|uniref:TonB-dependent receptor domain-containing protein n=1 Tax=Sphingomonas sp. MMS24-J13 TaxID=3238686 RepID=UPI0038509ED5
MPDLTSRSPESVRWGLSLAALAAATFGVAPVRAQDVAAPGAASTPAPTEEIIVTGSRLARSTFTTPTPVTVLGGEDLQRLGIVNVGQAVSELPAFRPSTTPVTQGFGSFNVGANIINLRGIGNSRSLILVDGRRFAPTTREGTVDLNLIPSILVGRTEVVTGGASAAYGSDAIAGAVNIILDKRLQGFKAQADYGISNQGDGGDFHAAAAYGTAFAGGAGHFIVGGEYEKQQGIGNCFTRSWCKTGAIITNPTYTANNGQPNFIRSDTNGGWFFNSAGVIAPNNNGTAATAAIRNLFGTGGITFNPDGSPAPYTPGSRPFGLSQIGGDLYPTYNDANITVPVKRYTGFAHAEYEFSDRLTGFVEGSYGHVGGQLLQTAYFSASIPIYKDNPYMPAAIRAIVGPAPATPDLTRPTTSSFVLGRIFDDVGRGYSVSTADTYRATAGLSGKLGGNWTWDGYYQYGRTDRLQTVANNLITGDPSQSLNGDTTLAASNARFFYALDAVRDPATGQITCRALLSANAALRQAATGCVPVNLFGAGNASQAAKNYIFGTLREEIKLQQHVAAANIRGDLLDLWAGPLSVATGGEYRVDKIGVTHDALSNQYAYFQNFGSDYRGTTKVVEGYVEAELPLVRDASWTKSLTLNGAARETHYDISGFGSYLRTNTSNKFTRTTWKASLLWEPVNWLRVRATQSHDIRAPNFADLYLASASSFTPIVNDFNRTIVQAPPSIVNGGTPNLKPERADTTTAGIVFSPKGGMLNGLRLSVDYYHIKVKGYIAQPPGGAQFIIDRCFAGVTAACGLITFANGQGSAITQILNVAQNLDALLTKGIDIESEYRIPLADHDHSIQLRALATYVGSLKATSFGTVVQRAGQTGGSAALAAPDWTVNGFVTYATPLFQVTVQGRYISPGLYDGTYVGPDQAGYATTLPNSITNNHVAGRFYVNLSGSIHIGPDRTHGFEVFGSINNLFDRDPPAAPETQFYTNPVYFDTIGRYFRVGARARF